MGVENTIFSSFLGFASQASGSSSNILRSSETTPPPPPTSSPPPITTSPPPTPPPRTPSPEPEPEDNLTRAEKTKEEGNVAFKTGKYQSAVDLYPKAIGKRRGCGKDLQDL